jgi:hypothetical protein
MTVNVWITERNRTIAREWVGDVLRDAEGAPDPRGVNICMRLCDVMLARMKPWCTSLLLQRVACVAMHLYACSSLAPQRTKQRLNEGQLAWYTDGGSTALQIAEMVVDAKQRALEGLTVEFLESSL